MTDPLLRGSPHNIAPITIGIWRPKKTRLKKIEDFS
jgi:hypothetical protein